MAGLQQDSGPPIKIGGEWRTRGQGPQADVEVRVAYSVFHAEANALHVGGVLLTQLSMFKRDDGWLLLLKGTRGERKLKSWIHAETFRGALTLAATSLDCAHVTWSTDHPRPNG